MFIGHLIFGAVVKLKQWLKAHNTVQTEKSLH